MDARALVCSDCALHLYTAGEKKPLVAHDDFGLTYDGAIIRRKPCRANFGKLHILTAV